MDTDTKAIIDSMMTQFWEGNPLDKTRRRVEWENSVKKAMQRNPIILECEWESIIGALMASHRFGFTVNTNEGLAYLLPKYYYTMINGQRITHKRLIYLLGYQGWITIMAMIKGYGRLGANIVFHKEHFEVISGTNPSISHWPLPPEDRGERKAAYAVFYYNSPVPPEFAVVYKEEIEQIKINSLKGGSDLWQHEEMDPFGWMWKKTAIKQLAKIMPKYPDLLDALDLDNALETGGYIVSGERSYTLVSPTLKEIIKNKQFEKKSKKVNDDTLSLFGTGIPKSD